MKTQQTYDRFTAVARGSSAISTLRPVFRRHAGRRRQSIIPTRSERQISDSKNTLRTGNIAHRLLQSITPPQRPTRELQLTHDRLTRTPTKELWTGSRTNAAKPRTYRTIDKRPYKVLVAPRLRNDYYNDLVDWSALNIIAVGLQEAVYLWDKSTEVHHKLWQTHLPDYISSCKFSPDGTKLVIGTFHGRCEVWAIKMDNMRGSRCIARIQHRSGVTALAWGKTKDGSVILSTGDKSGVIRTYSTTARASNSRHGSPADSTLMSPGTPTPIGNSSPISSASGNGDFVLMQTWRGFHTGRLVSLKWGDGVLASGGNDYRLCFWNLGSDAPKRIIHDNKSAIRGLDWCPWDRNLLAAGCGRDDRRIRVYNSQGDLQTEIYTGSQVCSVHWSKNFRELVSTQDDMDQQIVIRKWPSLEPTATLSGHRKRPLFTAMSPNGEDLLTGGGDEELKFWKCFAGKPRWKVATDGKENRLMAMDLR
ncbi:WD40-repeat-containing domain protein [Fimicolochytrium jonesii]|uniref:WD40-repeat-containing domain protein n=1 Tax=Fimicolochytrium jonesii TaxID=1396493 RepID=UPI0022FEDD52|nr:WD40-repeat-containing domain protein [Fimicolochytrium jonesii]KAI8815951.1 WD40-repeat-containing domain protein [Fimicolochytrium jonesii]